MQIEEIPLEKIENVSGGSVVHRVIVIGTRPNGTYHYGSGGGGGGGGYDGGEKARHGKFQG